MRKTTTGLGFVLVGLIGASSLSAAPVDSSPAATLAAFTAAMENGDAAALSKLVVGDAQEQAWAAAYASHLRAFAELDRALTKAYGDDYAQKDAGITIRDEMDGGRDDQFVKDLKQAKLGKPDGDMVLVIFDEAASDDLQGRLVKVDGHWKVQIESLANYFSVNDTAGLHAITDAATGLAREIAGGKFPQLDDAATAMQERMIAAEAVGAVKPPPRDSGRSPASQMQMQH